MKPIDYRNETFADLEPRLAGLREKVWLAWIAHGPATTRECAKKSGIDLLTFRPRTTELFQIGALMLEVRGEKAEGRSSEAALPSPLTPRTSAEGVYRARTTAEWMAWHAAEKQAALGRQLQLV